MRGFSLTEAKAEQRQNR